MSNTTRKIVATVSVFAIAAVAFAAREAVSAKPGGSEPASRFIVLSDFNDAAVQDTLTGLIWERDPQGRPSPSSISVTYDRALEVCSTYGVGNGQLGWRLPTGAEVSSLFDRSLPYPYLPANHPFTSRSSHVWTTTLSLSGTPMRLLNDDYGGFRLVASVPDHNNLWCVRSDI